MQLFLPDKSPGKADDRHHNDAGVAGFERVVVGTEVLSACEAAIVVFSTFSRGPFLCSICCRSAGFEGQGSEDGLKKD